MLIAIDFNVLFCCSVVLNTGMISMSKERDERIGSFQRTGTYVNIEWKNVLVKNIIVN